MSEQMVLGDRIKEKRLALGWSQQKLAKHAGVSQQIITRLETGKVFETKKALPIAKALGMSVDALLSDPWETGKLGQSLEHARVAEDDDLPMTPKQIGALLREKREAMGKTQSEVADWVGVTKGAVSHWEQGRVDGINPIRLHALAKFLQFDEETTKRLAPCPFNATLPILPQSEMHVMRMYAALPESVRAHVRGIIEALSASSREVAAMTAAYDATYQGAQDWMQKTIEGQRHEQEAERGSGSYPEGPGEIGQADGRIDGGDDHHERSQGAIGQGGCGVDQVEEGVRAAAADSEAEKEGQVASDIPERDALQARVARLEQICAAAYQMAGVVGAPVRFLDALALHDDADVEALLPIRLEECDEFRRIQEGRDERD